MTERRSCTCPGEPGLFVDGCDTEATAALLADWDERHKDHTPSTRPPSQEGRADPPPRVRGKRALDTKGRL